MSFDLTAKSDDEFSKFASRKKINKLLNSMSNVKKNGVKNFIYEGKTEEEWMEIDVEVVNADGDNIEDESLSKEVNCINFHMANTSQNHMIHCSKIAIFMAGELNWLVYDAQEGDVFSSPSQKKAWWKFW
ncbi:hypothetical protein [uncultured Cocleimonas sp.]|uniref:hypothetical protein n=1 Tax=uncultured Cocleimonas sp. TaxID=1051587 RepID=UPI002613B2BD|nr:hypothetical protein [uncultured Cocleimonas sp.]